MVEVFHYPHATVMVTWPYDTPEEKAAWEERVKEATADFLRAVYREREEKRRMQEEKGGMRA